MSEPEKKSTAPGPDRLSETIFRILMVLICAAGIWARFYQMEWHFSHADDAGVARAIFETKNAGRFDVFNVPKNWSYAPLQFLLTFFLIHPGQSYRGVLFWGRLPSAAASVLGLFAILLFYRLRNKKWVSTDALLGAVLYACSWESIIHAKQMHNYSLGLACMAGLLCLYVYLIPEGRIRLRSMMAAAACFGLAANAHYQVLLFLPIFFLILFILHAKRQGIVPALKIFIPAGILFMLLTVPTVYYFLLKLRRDTGLTNWNMGLHNEFVFSPPSGAGPVPVLLYAASFLLHNFFVCFDATLAFLPEDNALFQPFLYFFSFAFLTGLVSFLTDSGAVKRWTGYLFAATIAVWFTFVAAGKLRLSPTRHVLLFLPMMIACIVEGAGWLARAAARFMPYRPGVLLKRLALPVLSAAVLCVFLLDYGRFLEERRDVFEESAIAEVIGKYEADDLLLLHGTNQVLLMPSVQKALDKNQRRKIASGDLVRSRRVLWISREENWNPVRGKEIADFLNRGSASYHPYDVIYRYEVEKPVQVDYSPRTSNGMNAIYMYILKRRD